MTTYRIERMTTESYHEYMSGSNNYHTEILNIEAENAKEAIKKAEANGYIVNKRYVKSVEEIEAEQKANEEKWLAEKAKEEAKKTKKAEAEAKKAAEAGQTIEEYRKAKARKAYARRLEREIEEIEKELARKRATLKRIKEEMAG